MSAITHEWEITASGNYVKIKDGSSIYNIPVNTITLSKIDSETVRINVQGINLPLIIKSYEVITPASTDADDLMSGMALIIYQANGGGGGGSGVYAGAYPSNVAWGGIPSGTDLRGLTYDQIIQMATIVYVNPSFSSFTISGQATTVEIGTTISGSKTFTWGINLGSGTVPNLDVFDNTASLALVTNTPNDGTQSITIATVTFTTQGQTQSFRGIGHNTQNSTNFNSNNFVITGSYIVFYGPTPTAATDSPTTRGLPNNRFLSAGNSFSFPTGTVEKIFQIAVIATKSITVYDATAGFDITNTFTITTFNVLDAAGNNVSYKMHTLTNAVVYASSHTLNVTII